MTQDKVMPIAEDYIPIITKYSEQYGIDPKIAIDVATAESSLNANAKGKAGEMGLYQLHPKYADWISTTVTGRKFARQDYMTPDLNAQIGVGYLKYLKDQLGDNYSPALLIQSYNQGLGYTKKNNFQISDEMKKHPNKIYRSYFLEKPMPVNNQTPEMKEFEYQESLAPLQKR